MHKHFIAVMGSLALAGLPHPSSAQENTMPSDTSPPPATAAPEQQPAQPPSACPPGTTPAYQIEAPPPAPVPEKTHPMFAPHQMTLTLGGGVADFVRTRISDHTNVGGAWDVRFLAGARSYVAFEATYVGTGQGIEGTLDAGGGNIITHQFSGNLRFNMTRKRVQPFVSAGAGYQYLRFGGSGVTDTISFEQNTNSFVAPFAGGLSAYVGRHGVLDARGTYNLITNKSFTDGGARPDMWAAELRFGYAF
jgi:hypothetical protein